MTIRVLTPYTNTYTALKPMAARPTSLAGLRPGILENSKPNAQLLMESWVEGLRETANLGDLTIGHKAVTTPPSRETLDLLTANCDFVLVGTGDCGSCLAWTVRSAVALEERGIPTVCTGSHVFEDQFKLEAAHSGMPDLKFVFVEHPLGGLSPSAVKAKAARSLPDMLAAWRQPAMAQ
jgi:hypothetical protein